MGILGLAAQAAEPGTLGPGGWTAQPGWGQRSGTVWAWHLNQEAELADAEDPENRKFECFIG